MEQRVSRIDIQHKNPGDMVLKVLGYFQEQGSSIGGAFWRVS
jgi:hypothetical protein